MGNREPVQMNEPENREDDRGQCEMELKRLTEHIWVMPYEEERDRPNLGYPMPCRSIRGDVLFIASACAIFLQKEGRKRQGGTA